MDCWLKLFDMKKEYLVNVIHQIALIMSLPFVHTARRSYWLVYKVKISEKFGPRVDLFAWTRPQSYLNLLY